MEAFITVIWKRRNWLSLEKLWSHWSEVLYRISRWWYSIGEAHRKKATNSQQLPYTGSKELALAGLGLATASSSLFGVQKRSQRGSRCSSIGSLEPAPLYLMARLRLKIKNCFLITKLFLVASTHEALGWRDYPHWWLWIHWLLQGSGTPSIKTSFGWKSQLLMKIKVQKKSRKQKSFKKDLRATPETIVENPVVETPAPFLAVEEKQFLRSFRQDKRAW